jgi:hypothetical protein
MRKRVPGAAAVGLVVTVAFARRADRWHSVTVNCAPDQLDPLPAPLSKLGDAAEIVMRPAPGGRGTELAARLVEPVPSGIAHPEPLAGPWPTKWRSATS